MKRGAAAGRVAGPGGRAGDPDARSSFQIVLNYRRDDTAGHAGRLYDALSEEFGEDAVFMDIDKIEPGVNFVQAIERAIDACDVFIALIGRQWLTATDAKGRKRLESSGDFVRLEIETALTRAARIIPVLVQGAEMPASEELPPPLADLGHRNAIEIRDTSWRSDVDRLVQTLRKLEEEKRGDEGPTSEEGEEDTERSGGRDERAWLARTPVRIALALAAALVLAGTAAAAIVLLGGDGGGGDETAGGKGSSGTFTLPENQAIAFAKGKKLVVVVSGDGTETTVATGKDPAWSPDGKTLAFSWKKHIWTVPLQGGEPTQVTQESGVEDEAPAWSGNGDEIAFARTTQNEANLESGAHVRDIWVVNVRDGTGRNLTRGGEFGGIAPAWSWAPSGRIAFQRSRPERRSRQAIWVMDGNGAGQRSLTGDVPGSQQWPAWSPDGSMLAFVITQTSDRCVIQLAAADGELRGRLARGTALLCQQPTWSPDGKRIAFSAGDGIWAAASDGTRAEKVVSGESLTDPSWTAFGR